MAVRSTSTFLTVVLHGCLLFFSLKVAIHDSVIDCGGRVSYLLYVWCFPVYVQVGDNNYSFLRRILLFLASRGNDSTATNHLFLPDDKEITLLLESFSLRHRLT